MMFLTPMAAAIAGGVVVPALVALYFLKLRRREVEVSSTLLWKRAIKDMEVNSPFQKIRKNWLLLLQLLILLALLIALARPVLDGGSVGGRRVVILIDRSASMSASDVAPTRLDEAKKIAGEVAQAAVRGGGVMGMFGLGGGDSSVGGVSVAGASGVMVVSFGGGSGAQVVEPFTNDPSVLSGAIEGIESSDGTGGFPTALGLVEPYAREAKARGGEPLVVYVVSDGRVGELGNAALTGADLRFVKIGTKTAKNVGITAISARRDYRRPERVRLFVRLVNSSPVPVQGSITVRVDGQAVKVSPFAVPAATELKDIAPAGPLGGSSASADSAKTSATGDAMPATDGLAAASVELELTMASGGLVEVSHDVSDTLRADDRAALWVGKPRRLGVLVVTEGNAFLMQAVKASGAGLVRTMKGPEFESQGMELLRNNAVAAESQRFDVVIFDRYSPRDPVPLPGLYLGAAPPLQGVAMVPLGQPKPDSTATTRPSQRTGGGLSVVLDWRRDHPLLRHVNLGDLVIEGASRLTIPEGGEVLAVGMQGPLMGRVTINGKSHVMTAFSVLKSNWPLQVGFPVFVANAIEWLAVGTSGEAGISYRPGESAVIDASLPGLAQAASTLGPSGQQYVLGAPGAGSVLGLRAGGQVTFSPFERVGIYRPRSALGGAVTGNAGAANADPLILASNLANPLESDLRPAEKIAVGQGVLVAGQTDKAAVRREVWRWFAWAALALLIVEWLIWMKR